MGEFMKMETGEVAGVATLRLDRPKVNALSVPLLLELADCVSELTQRSDIRAVVLWGGTKAFSAGAELNELSQDDGDSVGDQISGVFERLEALPQITISAINGYALGGGCELAMATEFRLLGEKAVLGLPEILLGIIPGGGGTQRLTRLVGITKAKELIYSGRRIPAAEALEIGLASAVYPDDQVYSEALKLAATYAAGPAALRQAKRAITEGSELPLKDALKLESEAFAASLETEDARIGIASFFESGPGKATFTGK